MMRAAPGRGEIVDLNVELVVYALVATASPLGLGVTLAVIATGRTKSLLFAAGFVLAQFAACALIAVIDIAFVPGLGHERVRLRGVLEIAFGVVVLGLAVIVRRRGVAQTQRSRALVERLQGVRTQTAVVAGVLLGIGGPKRLVLTALAGTAIAASGASDSEALAVAAAYTAIATLLVWVPVLAFAVAGERIVVKLRAAQDWLTQHQRAIAFYSLLLIGAFAVLNGLTKVV
jgi:Sap, sulfolipid-1-addressing protein